MGSRLTRSEWQVLNVAKKIMKNLDDQREKCEPVPSFYAIYTDCVGEGL